MANIIEAIVWIIVGGILTLSSQRVMAFMQARKEQADAAIDAAKDAIKRAEK